MEALLIWLKSTGECSYYHKAYRCFYHPQNVDGMHLDVIVSYGRKPFDTISITEVPFFTGKPYIISSDSVMPEKFRLFMEKQAMRAAIFQPVNIDNRTQMYVCFFDEKDDRSWEKYDVKFLNDTKRVIQSILTKR